MELRKVKSSNIDSVGYENENLYIQYQSGIIYKYKNVPKVIYESLMDSDSKGRFMNSEIKNKYLFERLN